MTVVTGTAKALLQKCGGDRGTTPEPQIFPSVQIIHG